LVIAIIGAAAGFGVFLIALGGLAMWIRLDSVGLPAERGVGLVSKQTLAVVGAHALLEPLLFGSAIAAIGLLGFALEEPRPPTGRLKAWAEGAVEHGIAGIPRLSWLRGGLVFLVVLLLVPFNWEFMTLLIGGTLLYVGSAEMARLSAQGLARRTWLIGLTVALGLLLALGALAGQADKPVQLQSAAVVLNGGEHRFGYFVAEDTGAVYIGAHRAITAYPRSSIRSVAVRSASGTAPYKTLGLRLYHAVFN
jgi:hypothetical protein